MGLLVRDGDKAYHGGIHEEMQCCGGALGSQNREGMGEDEYHGEEQRRPWSLPRHDAKDPGDGERHAAAKQSRRGEIFSVFHVKGTGGRGIKGEENSRDAKGTWRHYRGSIL